MIDPRDPDYMNLPTCDARPRFGYEPAPADDAPPPVSIITPCYNVEAWYFDETVACVLQQAMQHFEWLLVDDGSTEPESVAQLEKLSQRDSRIRLIRQEGHDRLHDLSSDSTTRRGLCSTTISSRSMHSRCSGVVTSDFRGSVRRMIFGQCMRLQ